MPPSSSQPPLPVFLYCAEVAKTNEAIQRLGLEQHVKVRVGEGFTFWHVEVRFGEGFTFWHVEGFTFWRVDVRGGEGLTF